LSTPPYISRRSPLYAVFSGDLPIIARQKQKSKGFLKKRLFCFSVAGIRSLNPSQKLENRHDMPKN